MQIKAYDKLTFKAAYFAVYKAVKAKGIVVNESDSVLSGADVSGWNESDKAMLAALLSVKIITADDIAAVKSNDTVIRGEAAELLYKLTLAENTDDKPTDSSSHASGGCKGCKGEAGAGAAFPISLLAATVVLVIIRKRKS